MLRAAIVLALTTTTLAQPAEFKLDASGKWVPIPAATASADKAVMDKARTLLAQDRPSEAKSILTTWIEQNERTDSQFLAEAYLLRGDAKTAGGNEYRALYDYEAVTKDFTGSAEFAKAVERELEIGIRYVNGLRRRFLGVRTVDARSVGEELLVRTHERMPGSRLGERAFIELADYYYRSRDLKEAAITYDLFLQNYPKSAYALRARQQRIYASIGQFRGPNYDAASLTDARVLIEDYAKDDPLGAQRADLTDALLAKLDESQAAQKLEKARFYFRRGDPVSARATLRRLIKDHPQTVAAATGYQIMREHNWELPQAASVKPDSPATPPPSTPDGPASEPKSP